MRHNLNIRVSDKPRNGGVVACRTVSIREKLFTLLLGPKQKVMVVVPGNSVESIAITEVPMGGGVHEYDKATIKKEVASMKIKLNPDQEIVNTVREGLKRTGGYCPCRRERTEATKCMCQEFKDQIADPGFEGFCHCMLYYKSLQD